MPRTRGERIAVKADEMGGRDALYRGVPRNLNDPLFLPLKPERPLQRRAVDFMERCLSEVLHYE